MLIKIKNYQRCMTNTRCGRDNVKEATTESRTGRSGTGAEEMGDTQDPTPTPTAAISLPTPTRPFCDIFQPSHVCALKLLAHLLIFSKKTQSLAGWKSLPAWDLSLSIDTRSVTSKQSIFTYSVRIFSGRQNSKQNSLTRSPRAAVLSV